MGKLTKGTIAAVVRSAPCPYCGALAGTRCITKGGREPARPHGDRMAFYAMHDEGRREMFPHMFDVLPDTGARPDDHGTPVQMTTKERTEGEEDRGNGAHR